jgi:8-oxo-dGTP diphosphatase
VFYIKNPLLTVDTVITQNNSVVLIMRKYPPFKGSWALPGGFVEYGETVEMAAIRESKEETGLDIGLDGIVGVYSDPHRDPRGHIISICFLGHRTGGELVADTDAEDIQCMDIDEVFNIELAFDHHKILEDAFELLKSKGLN